jgi:glycerol kinase
MLFDIAREEWSEELCELLSVPINSLPEVMSSAGNFGETGPESPINPGIPISGIAGDQQAALFGQACFTTGQAKNTYGTGGFVLANLGNVLPDPVEGLLTTIAWKLLDQPCVYALEGSIFSSGSTVQWLRDGLKIIDQSSDLEEVALSVPDNGGVYTVPAFNGLGSPWWDPRASGMIIGLTRGTGRGEIARSVIESMSFQTRDVIDAMRAQGHPVNDLRIDGGASTMDLLMDIQSDQLKIPVTRSATAESTALGAAWLAGLTEGVWGSTEDLAELWSAERTAFPSTEESLVDSDYERWIKAVQRSKNWN